MLKNHIITACRRFLRDKTYFIANVLGLGVGIASFVLIYAFVQNELTYDQFHVNHQEIYRIIKNGDNSLVGPPVGTALAQEDQPGLEAVIRFTKTDGADLSFERKRLTTTQLYFADAAAMDAFSFEVLSGNAGNPLQGLNSVVLTETAAKNFFDKDPIGEIMLYQNEYPLTVTAVIKDVSNTTHLPFDALISHDVQDRIWGEGMMRDLNAWFWATTTCYVRVNKNTNTDIVEQNVQHLFERHIDDNRARQTKLTLQNLEDIYLNSSTISGFHVVGNITYVYMFSALAVLVLIVATINFINLASAKSIDRAREIGIRKSLGAQRQQLIIQFITEAYLVVLVSALLAVLFIELALPHYPTIIGKPLSLNWSDYAPILAMLVLGLGIISGAYPALVLSSFEPVKAIKGQVKERKSSISFQKVLVVSQFFIGIAVVIAAILVYQQMDYISKKELGFRKDQILVVDFPQISPAKYNTLKSELLRHSDILNVGGSWIPPFQSPGIMGPVKTSIDDELQEVQPHPYFIWVDEDFITTYEVEMTAGQNFSTSYVEENREFILNESAVKLAGWQNPEEAIGLPFEYSGERKGHIVGVVKDFHFESLMNTIKPLVMFKEPERINVMSIKVSSESTKSAFAFIEETLVDQFPNELYPITFLDQQYETLYSSVGRMQRLFGIFALLGLFTECLGLFALANHMASKRRKEVGIRKVLGASVAHIMKLFNWQLGVLIGIGFLLACPIAFFFVSKWLHGFAYHVSITPWPFITAGLVALLFAMITISAQTLKTARNNPVNALRTD